MEDTLTRRQVGLLRTHYLKIIDFLWPEIKAVRGSVDVDSHISAGASTITKESLNLQRGKTGYGKTDGDRHRWSCYYD